MNQRKIPITLVQATTPVASEEAHQILPGQTLRLVVEQLAPGVLEQGYKAGRNGAHCLLDTVIEAGDRIELYAPLPEANRRRIKERRQRA